MELIKNIMEKIIFVISLFFSLVLISCGVEEPSGGGNAQGGGSHSSVNHEYVDLGLPSGTLWATMNVGASSPEDYGAMGHIRNGLSIVPAAIGVTKALSTTKPSLTLPTMPPL